MCRVGAVAPSVRITTSPSQGPFRVDQTVQFTCEVEPAQEQPVTYHWKILDGSVSNFSTGSFHRTFFDFSFRHSWFYCTVQLNGVQIGEADRFFEIHGK